MNLVIYILVAMYFAFFTFIVLQEWKQRRKITKDLFDMADELKKIMDQINLYEKNVRTRLNDINEIYSKIQIIEHELNLIRK